MKQLEIENGDFPPKRSVEKKSDSVKITVTERSSLHFPPKEKLAKQLVFTEFGLSPVIATSPPLLLPAVEKPICYEMHSSPPSLFSSISKSSDSPIPIPWPNIRANNGTPKGPKQCGCKQSKCLKMYCDCFASGEYCNGCTCVDCCNNLENEDLKKAATEIILERNPHAFKPKISSSPCSPQDVVGDKLDGPQVGRHERGCNCKKTKCLKRYCECFQANVFCSQNCRCVDCKNFEVWKELMATSCKEESKFTICENFEGCEGRNSISRMDNATTKLYKSFEGSEGLMEVTGEDCIDTKIYVQGVITAATADSTGLSSQRLSQESRKRKHQEHHSNDKNSPSQSFSDLQKVVNQRGSCPSSTLSVEPICHFINSGMVGSLRDSFSARLTLANVLNLLDTSKLCSGLAVLAEAAALAQAANLFSGENKNDDILKSKEEACHGRPAQFQKRAAHDLNLEFAATDLQGGALSPGMVRLIGNEKHKQFMEPTSGDRILNRNLENAYAEQERSVLSSLLDFLEKFTISQNMKVDDSLLFPFCYLLCVSGTKISSHRADDAREIPSNAEDRNRSLA